MSDQESTTSQSKNNSGLVIVSGFVRLTSPDLEEEIGFDPAALFMQLEYWIDKRGFEQDGHRWFRISAKNISAWAFRTWSQRKVQRVLQTLREAGLILVEYFDGPYTTPYIALNKAAINEKLKSVRFVDPTEQADQSSSDPIDEQPPAPTKWAKGSTLSSKTAALPSMAAASPIDTLRQAVDAPSVTVGEVPPSTTVTAYKKDQVDSESTGAAGVPSKKRSKRQRKIIKRESAPRADVCAERATSSLNVEKQAAVGRRFSAIPKSGWDAFCEKLAEICGVDFDLEPGYIRAYASKLWKKGEGYTLEDLEDFDVWWNKFDWRGLIKNTYPAPKQVCECIRQSCEHEHTQLRRYMRERGYSPDDEDAIARYRYVFGELASYIKH